MSHDRRDRIVAPETARQSCQSFVLRVLERDVVATLEFDPDRVVIAARPAFPARYARVPRAPVTPHELGEPTLPVNDEVRRHAEALEPGKIRMRAAIEAVEKQIVYCRASEFTRRQTDGVYDEQIDKSVGRPVVAIRAFPERDAACEPFRIDLDCRGSPFCAGAHVNSSRRARP